MRGPGTHIRQRKGSDGRPRYMAMVEGEPDPATGLRRQVSAGTFRTKREAEVCAADAVSRGSSAQRQ